MHVVELGKINFIKQSTNPPHLFEIHSQNNSKALISKKFMTTWFSTFWLVMSYKMKEGVKCLKKVTMDCKVGSFG